WLPDAEYFSELAELTSGGPAWGLISAALGSKSKRTQFVERFFYGKRPSKATKSENEPAPLNLEPLDSQAQDEDLYTGEPMLDNPEADNEPAPKGMREWLNEQAQQMKLLAPAEKATLWRAAVKQ